MPRGFYQDIFAAWQNGITMKDLAQQYGVNRRTIGKIIHRAREGQC